MFPLILKKTSPNVREYLKKQILKKLILYWNWKATSPEALAISFSFRIGIWHLIQKRKDTYHDPFKKVQLT